MFRCKAFGPYTIHKICEDESVKVKDPRNSKVFSVKGKVLRASPPIDKVSKRVSLVHAKP